MRLEQLYVAAKDYWRRAYWLRVAGLVGLGLALVFCRERLGARTFWNDYWLEVPEVRSQFIPSRFGMLWLDSLLLGAVEWFGERLSTGLSRFDQALVMGVPSLDVQFLCVAVVALLASLARRVPFLGVVLLLVCLWVQSMMSQLAAGISPALYYKLILPSTLVAAVLLLALGLVLGKVLRRWRSEASLVEAPTPTLAGKVRRYLFGWNNLACTLPLFWHFGVRIFAYVVPAGRPYPSEARWVETAFVAWIVLSLLSLLGLGALRSRPEARTEAVGDALWIVTNVLSVANLVILFLWLRKVEGLISGDHLRR